VARAFDDVANHVRAEANVPTLNPAPGVDAGDKLRLELRFTAKAFRYFLRAILIKVADWDCGADAEDGKRHSWP
jgi:hypothetical protein